MDREGFRNRLKQYKKAREENPGLKYYDFMERLAEFKAKEWNDDSDMVLLHMLNDNSYNYQQMYEDNPNFNIQEGHFVDTYKTAYHPTFSEESMYSGKKSPYNPEGIIGGSWDESTKSFYLNDRRQSKRKAQDYLNHADPGYRAIPKYNDGGEVELVGEKEIQWFKDWYNKRMEYAIANNRPDIIKQLESLLYHFYPELYKYSLGVDWDDSIYTGTFDPRINRTKISINDQAIKDYEKKHGVKIGGYLHPSEGIVLPSNYTSNDLLHELAHTFNQTGSVTNAVNSAISDENGFVTIPKGLQNSEYWISPWEVHSRLMLFREENNIDPTKVYNEEDIKELRKSAKDKMLFEIFNDSQMMHLLNDVADNATTSADDRLFLKNGGIVPMYDDGGGEDVQNIGPVSEEEWRKENKAVAKEIAKIKMRKPFLEREGERAEVNPSFANYLYSFNFDLANHEDLDERKYNLENYVYRAYDRRKQEELSSVTPYVPEKEIMLSTGRFNTGRISTNVLDSLLVGSKRANVPFEEALGLAARESGLGYARKHREKGYITNTDLLSNWQQIQTIINSNVSTEKKNKIFQKYKDKEPITKEELDFVKKWVENEQKEYNSTKQIKENVFTNALRYYKEGKYNPNADGYEEKVKLEGKMLMDDPAIKRWRKTVGLRDGGIVSGQAYGTGGDIDLNTAVPKASQEQIDKEISNALLHSIRKGHKDSIKTFMSRGEYIPEPYTYPDAGNIDYAFNLLDILPTPNLGVVGKISNNLGLKHMMNYRKYGIKPKYWDELDNILKLADKDGIQIPGDRLEWALKQTENFKKFAGDDYIEGYMGIRNPFDPKWVGRKWIASKDRALGYTWSKKQVMKEGDVGIVPVVTPKPKNIKEYNAQGRNWTNVDGYKSTDELAGSGSVKYTNVRDDGPHTLRDVAETEYTFPFDHPTKVVVGNNGDFNPYINDMYGVVKNESGQFNPLPLTLAIQHKRAEQEEKQKKNKKKSN